MFLESKITEIAIGQIRGFVKPSKAERLAAFELFVELSVRVTTPSIDDNRGMLRDNLDNLAAIGDVTREILRKHGCDAAKGRNDGNITLAVVALRVYNEIILPRLILWEPELRDYEGERAAADPPQQPFEWELAWIRMPLAIDDLDAMRREIRSYMDTLGRHRRNAIADRPGRAVAAERTHRPGERARPCAGTHRAAARPVIGWCAGSARGRRWEHCASTAGAPRPPGRPRPPRRRSGLHPDRDRSRGRRRDLVRLRQRPRRRLRPDRCGRVAAHPARPSTCPTTGPDELPTPPRARCLAADCW